MIYVKEILLCTFVYVGNLDNFWLNFDLPLWIKIFLCLCLIFTTYPVYPELIRRKHSSEFILIISSILLQITKSWNTIWKFRRFSFFFNCIIFFNDYVEFGFDWSVGLIERFLLLADGWKLLLEFIGISIVGYCRRWLV